MRVFIRSVCLLTFFAVLSPLGLAGQGQDSPEAKFRASIVPSNIRESMRRLSARPHHVGSPYGKDNAEWMLARFKEFGWDAEIETFSVLFPTPKDRVLEMIAPTRFRAALEEPPVAGDITSTQTDEQLPTYNAARPKLATAPDAVAAVNQRLLQSERVLTDPAGLPGRPWYKHLLYAPGTHTGYGVKTMPGVREGLEQGRYEEAEREIVRVANALMREVDLLDHAAADLESIVR